MRHYELMVILDPELEERTVAPSLDKFLNVVRQGGGTVENVDIWGRRRLAYEIKKKTEGIYAVVDMTCEPAAVKELDRQLNLNESVLRTKVTPPGQRSRTRHGPGRHHDHGRRQPDRRPRAAVHPSRCGGRQLHRRLAPRGCSTGRPTSGRTATPSSCAATCGVSTPRTSPSRSPAASRVIVDRPAQAARRTRPRKARSAPSSSCEVDEVGPALRYATAKVTKVAAVAAVAAPAAVRRRRQPALTTRGPLRPTSGGQRRWRRLRRLRVRRRAPLLDLHRPPTDSRRELT